MKLTAAAVMAAISLTAASAGAADPPADKAPNTEMTLRATPVFGADAAMSSGWTEIAVSLENTGTGARQGTIELIGQSSWSGRDDFVARAPFHVAGGRSVVVKLPTHGSRVQAPSLSVHVTDNAGKPLAKTDLGSITFGAPLLVDVHQPSRLAPALRGWTVTSTWWPTGRAPYMSSGMPGAGLTVGVPTFDRATGDPILPDRAAGYSAATVVLLHTDVLARLEASAADALLNWVVTGGTLALVPAREIDLRGPLVTTLVGGAASPAPPSPALLALPPRARPTDPGLFPTKPLDPEDPPAPLRWDQGTQNPFVPIRTAEPPGRARLPEGPSPAIRERLHGYAGGNLEATPFGASAAYGTGEVHLLAFDPTEAPMLDDAWVHGRMIDLVERAWNRRARQTVPHGGGDRDGMSFDGVRRALDPNENFRPALGVAAILLVLYSIVAGPLTFLRAARKGKPLAPLLWAPILSLVTFLAIVAVGFVVKGWHGRVRHLAIVESGAGAPRGSIRRFRGFFTSESRALSIPSTDPATVLAVVAADSMSSQDKSVLAVDRNGVTLEDINALPWQTIVVQEDGVYDFKGGVTIAEAKDGSLDVTNHTGRLLKNVLVHVPTVGVHYVEQLADGASLQTATARNVFSARAMASASPASGTTHPLVMDAIAAGLRGAPNDGKHADELRAVWLPMDTALGGGNLDWWPDGVPVVLAEVDGGEGSAKRDANLPVESDRMVIRVLGREGAALAAAAPRRGTP